MEYLGRAQPHDTPVFFDHFAFRTFGVRHAYAAASATAPFAPAEFPVLSLRTHSQVPGLGISSLSAGLMDLGYQETADRLTFETKKLQVGSSHYL